MAGAEGEGSGRREGRRRGERDDEGGDGGEEGEGGKEGGDGREEEGGEKRRGKVAGKEEAGRGGGWRRRAHAGQLKWGGGFENGGPPTPAWLPGVRDPRGDPGHTGRDLSCGRVRRRLASEHGQPSTATRVGGSSRAERQSPGRVPPRTRPCTSAWLFKLLTKWRREAGSPPRA